MTTMTRALVLAAIPLVAAARSPAQNPAGDPARAGDAEPAIGPRLAGDSTPAASESQRELELLTARIAELEKAISAARAAPRALSPPPTRLAAPPAGPAPSQLPPAAVSTAGARDAGAKAPAGAGDAAEVKLLLDLFQRRDAPALAKELGSLLERGEPARATLYDFLTELDRDSRQALLLSYDYRFSFSLVHLAMLHEDELAKFAHYFLAATANASASTLRRTLFDFLPDFIRYYRGRYPELERDIEREILRRLKERKGNLQMYFGAMESLGYKPPIEVFDPLLEAASSHAETLPVALHLQARNDAAAVEILSRNISRTPPGNEWRASIMLDSLVRMSAPEAARAMGRFVYAPDDGLRGTAVRVYFSVPRDESSLPMVQEFLNADVDLEQKRLVIRRLGQQPAIFEALKKRRDNLPSEVQEILANEALQPPR